MVLSPGKDEDMKRSDDEPLFLAVSGEGENASVVTTLREARAWLCRQFYGVDDPPLHAERHADDRAIEEARWQSLIEPANWSTCRDGLEYEYVGSEDGATVRAFFVTDVARERSVHVVCGNDYPDAAFSTEAVAEAYVRRKRAERKGSEPRIHWHAHEVLLDEEGE